MTSIFYFHMRSEKLEKCWTGGLGIVIGFCQAETDHIIKNSLWPRQLP